MFPMNVWFAYTAACVLLVLAPGPDNVLAIGRGLSQGKVAAAVSGMASGAGILFHVAAASLGLTLLMQTSVLAFWVIKLMGAGYLLWLGIKVLRARNLISFQPASRQSLPSIFLTGLLSAALNPKPGLFVLAFIPQFVDPARGSVSVQMLVYGVWFAALTALGFALMGIFATGLSRYLYRRPRLVNGLNVGAGLTFVASGVSIAALSQR
ncbi:LysE family translocator [Pseudomonas sp. BO3-4]|uniref:Amino acid transporter LysE n=2 Tax=Pseudomonas TaxID=286 RepID=I7C610_PSEPT|nr:MULTISPECIES: LysE family translocator [Pseudomonas]AFO47104.1 amino acid transporter LysE [Pseudomonas putida DOT-T1E]UZM91541.1 LysE family translocator [Pseudomonas putida DOT-T1E]WPO28396.1 LysE family translocator [Pseudomonas sp. BO3-4]